MSVVNPTSTPGTSVMALYVPGVPSNGTPRSRARTLALSFPFGDCALAGAPANAPMTATASRRRGIIAAPLSFVVDLCRTARRKCENVIVVRRPHPLHPGRPHRHPGHREPCDLGMLVEHAHDELRRHVALDDIPAHDCCVAGLERPRYSVRLVERVTLGCRRDIVNLNAEAGRAHLVHPCTATPTVRIFVDHRDW